MSDLLHEIQRTRVAILKDNEEPKDLLLPETLEPMLRAAFGIHLHPHPVKWQTYYGMRIEWMKPGTLPSIRTAKGDIRICGR